MASLALGIASVGMSFLLIGFLFGVVGIALGFAYLSRKKGPKGMARWGIGLSIVGMVASIGFGSLYYYFFHQFGGSFAGGVSTTVYGALANPKPLTASNAMLRSNLLWSATIPGAQAICAGDWDSDGSTRVLVAAGQTLHVLDLTGSEKSTLRLPDRFTAMECGRNKTAGARLLGYSVMGGRVLVIDHSGKEVWSQGGGMGLDGAHWGDLNGDGNDEMVMGMNGFGGLKVLSSDGQKLWSTGMANVWSQAIIPPASNRPALVLATDAGGSVNVFSAVGTRLNTLRPDGGFFMELAAGPAGSNGVQILGFSGNAVEAFDQTGKCAWTTTAFQTLGEQRPCAVMGDFKGDGSQQWAFLDGAGDLVIATTGGLKISSLANQSRIEGFAVAPRKGEGALLLILKGGVVTAYSFVR